MVKAVLVSVVALVLSVGVFSTVAQAQTTTTPSPTTATTTPTPSAMVPEGAPATGFGGN